MSIGTYDVWKARTTAVLRFSVPLGLVPSVPARWLLIMLRSSQQQLRQLS